MLLNTHHMWALANSQLLSEARYRYSYERPFNTIHSSRADVFLNTLNNCIMTFFLILFHTNYWLNSPYIYCTFKSLVDGSLYCLIQFVL